VIVSEPGYVYVLFNPPLRGLVKIGRTARDPKGRAEELSSATGVPTPFEVAYDAYFADADAAEQFVHATLTEKGFRRASNREFFQIALSDAVRAVVAAQALLGASVPQGDGASDSPSSKAFDELCDFAGALLRGEGDTLQDKKRAVDLYRGAADGGSIRAALELGEIWLTAEANVDSKDIRRWLEWASDHGASDAWGYLAILWRRAGNSENARKCWDRLLKCPEQSIARGRVAWAILYVISTPVKDVTAFHRHALHDVRDLVLSHSANAPLSRKIELALFPEIAHPHEVGRVLSIRDGVVSISGGYSVREEHLRPGVTLQLEQQVEFVADFMDQTALDIRPMKERTPPDWGLIDEIRKRLEEGGIDHVERAALLKRVRDELQR
jgi:hypothetical protein